MVVAKAVSPLVISSGRLRSRQRFINLRLALVLNIRSWTAKVIIQKIDEIGLYREALLFFLGLILGEYMVGGAWVIVRLITGFPVYSFYR